jgi:predicted metalloprotease with PDZ domain
MLDHRLLRMHSYSSSLPDSIQTRTTAHMPIAWHHLEFTIFATAASFSLAAPTPAANAQKLQPIQYTVRMPAPETHLAHISARIPTGAKPYVDLMMAVWSPGYYVQENYATHVQQFSAATRDGHALAVEQPQPNRWRVKTNGASTIAISYTLVCDHRSVTGDWIDTTMAILNGPATYITLADHLKRRHDVALELPSRWKQSATSLAAASDSIPNHYQASSYDELADSPIIAGNISFHEFEVAGAKHYLADIGEIPPQWDGGLAAQNLKKIVTADSAFWGFLPFRKYVFLNVFRQGGGGLEHLNSTLLTSSPKSTGGGDMRWLQYVSHEYFHAFNVKRLRPVQLGPFDYEHPPKTPSLWISEGLTTYYGNLMVSRGGIGTKQDVLDGLSKAITSVQNSPGRHVQTLEQASLDIFSTGGSGIGGDRNSTVSYYDKGLIVGLLLDARIQHATNGAKSLDDMMRLAYKRYGGAHGFTPQQWVATASDVAGTDLTEFFHTLLQTTDEMDYSEALAWFGLRFAPSDNPATAWTLEISPDATPQQTARLDRLTQPPRRAAVRAAVRTSHLSMQGMEVDRVTNAEPFPVQRRYERHMADCIGTGRDGDAVQK